MEIKNNNLKKVITLDGPAGSGKSTIAKLLAKELNYFHVDSGAIYRGYTYAVIQKIGLQENSEIFGKVFIEKNILPDEFLLEVKLGNQQEIFLNKENITHKLRTRELTQRIKYIADNIYYRNKVNSLLRKLAEEYPIVVDGRDMGTEVFPDSFYKFYLEANIEVRAQRRYNDYINNDASYSIDIDIEEIKKEIQIRDEQDKNRKVGALKIPSDAIIIDTSFLSRNMVLNLIMAYLQKKF